MQVLQSTIRKPMFGAFDAGEMSLCTTTAYAQRAVVASDKDW